jgi:hypothetical protein
LRRLANEAADGTEALNSLRLTRLRVVEAERWRNRALAKPSAGETERWRNRALTKPSADETER